jgi:hypothetical protein
MKLHSEEIHDLYSSPNIIIQIKSWRMRWKRKEKCKMFLGGKPEGKKPLGIPR